MPTLTTPIIRAAFASFCALATAPTAADEASPPSEWQAVDEHFLDDVRGGFVTDIGLKISFGIERTVSVNGEVLRAVKFSAEDVGKLVNGKVALNLPTGTTELIQNGPGNVFEAGSLASGATATFIQNSLNDQTIQSHTVISTATNALEILKGMNLQSVLNDALVNAAALR